MKDIKKESDRLQIGEQSIICIFNCNKKIVNCFCKVLTHSQTHTQTHTYSAVALDKQHDCTQFCIFVAEHVAT